MEIIVHIYFGINLMMLGSYLLDSFNDDSKLNKLFSSVVLFFFGTILVIYELTIADRVEMWWDNSEIYSLWSVYIIRKFDNLQSDKITYLKKLILAENKNSKMYRHLNRIIKRNEVNN